MPRYRFEASAGFFSRAQAGPVVGHDDDLDAYQSQLFKAETCDQRGGTRGDALALARLTHPITEVGAAMRVVELVESAPTEQFAGLQIENRERKVLAARPAVLAMADPCARLIQVVTRMAPGQPATHTGY